MTTFVLATAAGHSLLGHLSRRNVSYSNQGFQCKCHSSPLWSDSLTASMDPRHGFSTFGVHQSPLAGSYTTSFFPVFCRPHTGSDCRKPEAQRDDSEAWRRLGRPLAGPPRSPLDKPGLVRICGRHGDGGSSPFPPHLHVDLKGPGSSKAREEPRVDNFWAMAPAPSHHTSTSHLSRGTHGASSSNFRRK